MSHTARETLADFPFTADRKGRDVQLERANAGAPVAGYYTLAVHPVTARPCALWQQRPPARRGVPDPAAQREAAP